MRASSERPFGPGSRGRRVRAATVCSRFAVPPGSVGGIAEFARRCAALIGLERWCGRPFWGPGCFAAAMSHSDRPSRVWGRRERTGLPQGWPRMNIFVINLPRAEARRNAMSRQFRDLGLTFEFFAGTDWRELSAEDWLEVDRKTRASEGRRPLSPGMVACHLSHRRVLGAIASGDEKTVAVFEDDVSLAPDVGTVLETLEASERAGKFDIIFLQRNHKRKPFVPLASIAGGRRLGLVKYSDWGAQAYVVSQAGAGQILKRFPKIIHRNDHTLHAYWENGLNIAYLDPPAAAHGIRENTKSLLQEGTGNTPVRPLLTRPRRLYSIVSEEIRKRRSFVRRKRLASRLG